MDTLMSEKNESHENDKLNQIIQSTSNKLVQSQKFIKLQKDTDLNKINENSFWKSSLFSYFNRWTHNKSNHDLFASLKMADMYVDDGLLGEIDVISNSENIKELLKMPFDKHKQVSLMIHRIGKTLLIDEFDIHAHLLKMEENEWQWLKKFFYEIVLQAFNIKHFIRQNKSRKALTDRDLLLKFLCSSSESDLNTRDFPLFKVEEALKETQSSKQKQKDDCNPQQEHQQPQHQQQAHRQTDRSNVFWTFENMKMLIGSNLPIFGDENRPAITLRLRDMRKPISILTGLDYWLDNLICNIPELHMCYHIDGIVQNYEVIKTEDIPYLGGSEFPPNVVKTIAKNILSFLKSNVTKEGHTYWLFKGPDDEIVKLYDLTSLCDDYLSDKYDNAYTVPVAMLLYRVANNMIHSKHEKNMSEMKTIFILLKKCLEMLDRDKHPEVFCSACYLITDLFVRDTYTLDNSSKSSERDNVVETSQKEINRYEVNQHESTLELNSLKHRDTQKSKTKLQDDGQSEALVGDEKLNEQFYTLVQNQIEKAKFSIEYLSQGVQALEINEKKALDDAKSEYVKDPDNFSRPERVIPLAFYKISSTQLNTKSQSSKQLTIQSLFNRNKALLIQKALVCFYLMACNAHNLLQFGNVFKYLKLASSCLIARKKLWSYDENIELSRLLSNMTKLEGDSRLCMIQQLKSLNKEQLEAKYMEEYNDLNEFEVFFARKSNEIIQKHVKSFEFCEELTQFCNQNFQIINYEENYTLALKSYEFTMKLTKKLSDEEVEIRKRYANAKNELGTYYLNECSNLMRYEEENVDLLKRIEILLQKSLDCFQDGISWFECIRDTSNCALLTANCAKLMRFYSRFFTESCFNKLNIEPSDATNTIFVSRPNKNEPLFRFFSTNTLTRMTKSDLFNKEKNYLHRAIDLYQKALGFVEQKNDCNNDLLMINNSLLWDLSTTCFNLACLMQDHAPNALVHVSHDEIEKEITDFMNKSINYLKQIKHTKKSALDINYRVAVIHHRLASLYHHSFRKQVTLDGSSEIKKRHLKTLADAHYEKATSHYEMENFSCERLRVLLEEIALSEFQFENSTSNGFKIKCLENTLKIFDKCKECLIGITMNVLPSINNDDMILEANKLTKLLIQRIQFILKNLIKCYSLKKKPTSEDQTQAAKFKTLYLNSISQFDLSKYTTPHDSNLSLLKTRIYNDLINFLNLLI